MIEQVGNCVEILGQLIPAVNIQVEDMPGFYEMADGEMFWFPLYFEILFEDGDLWVVHQGDSQEDLTGIIVEWHDDWAHRQETEADWAKYVYTWEEFLENYNAKRMNRGWLAA